MTMIEYTRWILVLIFVAGTGISSQTLEFKSEAECQMMGAAAEAALEAQNPAVNVSFTCLAGE